MGLDIEIPPMWAFAMDAFSNILVVVGMAVQKIGLREVEKRDVANNYTYCKNITWWIGFMLLVAALVLRFVALPHADMTLLAANSCFAIIVNLIIAVWLFDEIFMCEYDFTALVIINVGSLLIVGLANKAPPDLEGE